MRVLVIANPKAGQGVRIPAVLRRLMRVPVREYPEPAELRVRVESRLASHGAHVEWAQTNHAGHATDLARHAVARGVEVVVAIGGDGTVNEVVNGLAGSQAALAVIPGGTANLLAGELGIPAGIDAACDVVLQGRRRIIDLPFVNGRYFTMMAGIGFDAHVVRMVDRRLKGRFGMFSYLIVTVREILRYSFHKIHVRTDAGESLSGFYMFVQNAQSYGSGYTASPDSLMDDGVMELIVFPMRSLLTVVQYLLSADKKNFNVQRRTIKSLVLESVHDIQIDGDFFGQGPAQIGMRTGFLTVVVP